MPFLFFNQYYVIAVSIYSTFCAGEPTNERLSEWVSECALLLAFCLCLFECFLTLPSHFRIILTSSHLSVGIGIFLSFFPSLSLSHTLSLPLPNSQLLSFSLCLTASRSLFLVHSIDIWRCCSLCLSRKCILSINIDFGWEHAQLVLISLLNHYAGT